MAQTPLGVEVLGDAGHLRFLLCSRILKVKLQDVIGLGGGETKTTFCAGMEAAQAAPMKRYLNETVGCLDCLL